MNLPYIRESLVQVICSTEQFGIPTFFWPKKGNSLKTIKKEILESFPNIVPNSISLMDCETGEVFIQKDGVFKRM
jgi:hypothetical protein